MVRKTQIHFTIKQFMRPATDLINCLFIYNLERMLLNIDKITSLIRALIDIFQLLKR